MKGEIAAIVAFDEIVIKLREPPVDREACEIAAQLRALADKVRAGRDEWVIAAARRAQRLAVTAKASRPWRPWRYGL